MSNEDSNADAVHNSCPSCGGLIDVSAIGPFTEIECPHCSQQIRVRTQFDQFAIQSSIGEGGMSRVFAANDTRLGRSVALKVLHPEYSRDSVRMAQFEREAKLTAGVSHPHVVKVYSVGKDQGYFYIAMEHVIGRSLEQVIRDDGPMDEAALLDLAIQVAGGLRAAHLEGLIHRDVKPGNILITGDQVAKLVDFGLAIFSEGEQDLSGEIWATPYYVPPEKLDGQPEDLRSDIYSLGATLFHALAGRPPFDADTNSLEELKRIKSRPVRLEQFAPHAGPRTAAVVDRMMAREPDDRYQTYDDLLEALNDARSLLGTQIIEAHQSIPPWVKLGGVVAGVLLLGLVLIPMLRGPGDGGGGSGDPLFGDASGSVVLTSDGSTVSEKFIQSREALFDGRFADAEIGFRELMTLSGVRQPTLNWARFNAALCAWIEGDSQRARTTFASILQDAGFSDAPRDADLVNMFRMSGEFVAQPKPYTPELAARFSGRPDLVLGLLALAFERWAAGDLTASLGFMEQFSTASAGMSEHSMNNYRELADPYLHDLRMARPWVQQGSPALLLESALDERKDLAKAASELRTTRGPVRDLVSRRLESLDQLIQSQRAAQAEEERQRLEEVTRRELEMLATLNDSLEQYRLSMNFPAAVAALENARFESPEARAARMDRLYLWTSAEQFVVRLLDDLANAPHSGSFQRRDAPPIQGQLVATDRNEWYIRVSSGEITVPFKDLDPRWLIRLARQKAEATSDSTEYYQRQEWIVSFAHVTQQMDVAEQLAASLMLENRSFRERWQRVLELTFGG